MCVYLSVCLKEAGPHEKNCDYHCVQRRELCKVCKFLVPSNFKGYLGHFSIFYLVEPVEAVFNQNEMDDNHHYITTIYKAVILW